VQGVAFGTSASYHNGQRVIATAQGPTFASEGDDVHILLLKGGSPSMPSLSCT
jgi:hypothetical protein